MKKLFMYFESLYPVLEGATDEKRDVEMSNLMPQYDIFFVKVG